MGKRAGIDTGGTFTDLVLLDEGTGRIEIAKRPSTPAEPAAALFDVLRAADGSPAAIDDLVLGTTIGTNALLERRGARVIYITSRGFRDIPIIQRVDKRDPYNLGQAKPRPLVERRDCLEISERVLADGTVVTPLDDDEARGLADEIAQRVAEASSVGGVAVAVNLLFSFANVDHELRLAELLRERVGEDIPVACSHEVAPVWREYERASTTVAEAFLRPTVSRLVSHCEHGLDEGGFTGSFSIMKSNGGQMRAGAAASNAIQTVLSGLAGGIVAGKHFGKRAGSSNLITLDMGGTSADIGIAPRGEIRYTNEFELEWGLPISAPAIDLTTIGAGGGSIAWIDEGGLLQVGPRSAGAEPGPVCYGQGGDEVTVTDANLVLGRLDPDYFLGGGMRLNRDRALAAVDALAQRLRLTTDATASAIVELACERMANAIRRSAIEHGLDPADFDLVAFGGAGPLHATAIALSLGSKRVIIPPHPGFSSAFGTLLAKRRVDRRWTQSYRSDEIELATVNRRLDTLAASDLYARWARPLTSTRKCDPR